MTAQGTINEHVVIEVNGETGDVDLNAADVGADPAGSVTTHTAASDPHGDRAFAINGLAGKLNNTFLDVPTTPVSGTWQTGDIVLTRLGLCRCTSGGTPGNWQLLGRLEALDKGFAGWTFDPAQVQDSTIIPTSGLSFVVRFQAQTRIVSSFQVFCGAAGVGMTNAWASLHNDSGAVLGTGAKSAANQASAFESQGLKTFALNTAQGLTTGAYYRARFWFTASGTLPELDRAALSAPAGLNPGLPGTGPASTPYGWASADSGLTDMASAPDQIGTLTPVGVAWWLGATP